MITLVDAASLGRMHRNINASPHFQLIFAPFLLKTQGAITNTTEAININISDLTEDALLLLRPLRDTTLL